MAEPLYAGTAGELRIENLRTSRVKFEVQPVYAGFARKSARKDRDFLWHTDMKKLVGHAETYFTKLKSSRR